MVAQELLFCNVCADSFNIVLLHRPRVLYFAFVCLSVHRIAPKLSTN